jgi:hypothetical protein
MFSLADDRVEAMVSEYMMYPPVVRFDFLTRIVNLVGEILEGTERPAIEMLDERIARVRGDVTAYELDEELGVSIPEGEEFETVAGFVYGRLGRVPDEGDAVEHDGVRIEVEKIDDTRVRTLRVTTPEWLSRRTPPIRRRRNQVEGTTRRSESRGLRSVASVGGDRAGLRVLHVADGLDGWVVAADRAVGVLP